MYYLSVKTYQEFSDSNMQPLKSIGKIPLEYRLLWKWVVASCWDWLSSIGKVRNKRGKHVSHMKELASFSESTPQKRKLQTVKEAILLNMYTWCIISKDGHQTIGLIPHGLCNETASLLSSRIGVFSLIS